MASQVVMASQVGVPPFNRRDSRLLPLCKIVADNSLNFLKNVFQEKLSFGIAYELSAGQTIHRKCQAFFF